ncbi:hypothetical protein AB4Z48_06175 [Cupriavidus sp. 2TAF22]|uniref:hypothetical protein n=1 Tax=unclassified Cupriavidus TaxID=2640874 RepID=UPI003F8FA1C4
MQSIAFAPPAAQAGPALTPDQAQPPGYLEAVSTGYGNGRAFSAPEGIAALRLPRAVAPDARSPSVPSPPAPAPAATPVMPVPGKPRRAQ